MISAIILAAGESKRMGQPKMLLPWGEGTVLTHVLSVFREAGVEDILVITGGVKEQVEELVSGLRVRTVFNETFQTGEMLSSIQCGIRALTGQTQAALIGLGDQPQVQAGSVRRVCEVFLETKSNLVVPSYRMRRGHPWLIAHPLWDELLRMTPPQSPRDFLNAHAADIHYVNVDDPNILADLDTPEEYRKWQAKP
ncbi:MAG TPA: nucleotidyltransferase family protein [Anaerolineales bacterium]|nr:nucleotidyltransferase family protein [Anaerolineales bacterium]